MSFDEAYEEWKIYAQKRHKKQGFETLTQNFKKHVLPYFAFTDINDLKIKDVLLWQDKILEQDYSNNYNKNLYVCFNDFFKFCILNEYVSTNYLESVGPFTKKLELKEHDVYTLFDYLNFRKGLKGNIVYRYFFDFLFYYGPRSGEAMALKFSNLKLFRLNIGATIHRRGEREICTPKTKNSYRILKIHLIMRFKLFILQCYYIKKYGDNDFDYFIFGGKKPLSPTSIRRNKHNACVNRNIREITIHEFRHSCATRKIRLGIPVRKVSRDLGHSSIAITLDIYVHEKKEKTNLLEKCNFFKTLTQNFKKILQSIITHYV